jgi:DNA-binding response OmpR family regulator
MNQSARILVVDDDPDIGVMLKMMLEYKGYTPVVAERAEEAMDALNADNITLIIMDMLLSGVNGTDICANLKNDPERKNIPVIMISAHPNAKEICMNAGADDFIAKPFDMRDMLTRIGGLIKPT